MSVYKTARTDRPEIGSNKSGGCCPFGGCTVVAIMTSGNVARLEQACQHGGASDAASDPSSQAWLSQCLMTPAFRDHDPGNGMVFSPHFLELSAYSKSDERRYTAPAVDVDGSLTSSVNLCNLKRSNPHEAY